MFKQHDYAKQKFSLQNANKKQYIKFQQTNYIVRNVKLLELVKVKLKRLFESRKNCITGIEYSHSSKKKKDLFIQHGPHYEDARVHRENRVGSTCIENSISFVLFQHFIVCYRQEIIPLKIIVLIFVKLLN